jgi:Na+-transporting methylmalonyl-CoA/oxaloacetate decarboxylase gamma subunit
MSRPIEEVLLAQTKNFLTDMWEKINTFFNSYTWQEILFNIKVVFVVITFILFLFLVILIIRIKIISPLKRYFLKAKKEEKFNKKKLEKKIKKIDNRIKSGIEANYKLAVLEIEKLFDRVLKEIGYGAEKKLDSIDEIKQAGKIKKNIIEDKKTTLSKESAEKAVSAYKKGLKELGIL